MRRLRSSVGGRLSSSDSLAMLAARRRASSRESRFIDICPLRLVLEIGNRRRPGRWRSRTTVAAGDGPADPNLARQRTGGASDDGGGVCGTGLRAGGAAGRGGGAEIL